MRKNILSLLIGLGIVAVVVIVLVTRGQNGGTNTLTVNTNTTLVNNSTNASNANAAAATGNVNSASNQNTSATNTNSATNTANANVSATAQFVDYSAAALVAAQQRGRAVLYFHANWCPVCKVLEPDLRANIGTFPADVTILKVDYDQETSLKQQYGVTYQHTFVQVDANGAERKQWSGGDGQASSVRANIL